MMSAWSHRGARRGALVVLLVLLSSLIIGAFVHTDDGCAVERHCPACAFAMHHADGASAPQVDRPVSRAAQLLLALAAGSLSGEAGVHSSRGPPPV